MFSTIVIFWLIKWTILKLSFATTAKKGEVKKIRKITRGNVLWSKFALLFTASKFNPTFSITFTQNQIERSKKLHQYKGKFSCSKHPCRSSMLFCAYFDSGRANLSLFISNVIAISRSFSLPLSLGLPTSLLLSVLLPSLSLYRLLSLSPFLPLSLSPPLSLSLSPPF